MISATLVKELREKTGAGMMDCKRALTETGGEFDKAIELLRQKGLSAASKKSGRIAAEGVVDAYIHLGGRIGVLVEVNCETDFVARTDEFRSFVRDIAMQVAATNPSYLSREDVPAEVIEKEKEILKIQALHEGKPEKIVDKIVAGRVEKFYTENCLLDQAFIRDPDITVTDLLKGKISKTGENINIRRFMRYEMGEGLAKKACDLAAEVAQMTSR
ncbi:MAG: translation elongation factor Ts [Dethiobacter sp.]|nr:translation elongation factor Ts [Dethiobacter sp.]MCL5982490.1 translation elongation factor Ts [Bacillota bacterium]